MSGTGVDQLIERLHRDGVEAGRAEAARLLAEAQADADRLRAAARAERDLLLDTARREAAALREAGEAALALAYRDTLLRTRETLAKLIAERLGRHVGAALAEPALITDLVRIAARSLAGDGSAELSGPALDRLNEALAAELLAEGVTLAAAPGPAGLRARRDGASVVLELDEASLSAWLLAHLAPRFRALLDDARPPAGAAA